MKFELILMLILTSTTISCCYDIQEEVVEAGKNVTLKCVNVSANISELEWTRPDLAKNKYVFFYRNNIVDEEVIDQRFQGRVKRKDPQTADIVLENVTVNDTGTYECWVYIQDQKSAADGVDHNPPDREINLIVTDEIYKVKAKPGEDVPLKCVNVSGNISQLEWTRVGLAKNKSVFFYQDNIVNEEVIDQRFQGRVTQKDPQTADIVLENVTVKDTGTYMCRVYGENQRKKRAAVGDHVPPNRVINLTVTDGDYGGAGGSSDSDVVTTAVLSAVGVVAVLVVVGALVFLVVRRKRQREIYKEVKVVVTAKPGEDVPLTTMPQGTSTSQLENTTSAFNDPQTADIILERVTNNDTGIYQCVVHLEENLHQNGAAVGVDDPPHRVVNLIVTDDIQVVEVEEAEPGEDVPLKSVTVSQETSSSCSGPETA